VCVMSAAARIETKNYITKEVEEELYAGSNSIPANSTTPVAVESGRIPPGYEGIALSLACTQDANCRFYLKKDQKQHYPNGLNTAGLGGLSDETLLLVPLEEGQAWEIGFTNLSGSAVTINWRFRVRLFKK